MKKLPLTRAQREAARDAVRPASTPAPSPTPSAPLPPVPIVEWRGMYNEGWNDIIVPEAFAHPAKIARALVRRIYDELFALGGLTKGSCVVDPFGGVGTTGIEGAYRGCQVVCCELEPKFVTLAQENFDLHTRRWTDLGLPQPIVIQGDSRQLRQHVWTAMNGLISSPPFLGSNTSDAGLATSAHARDVIERGGLPKVGHLKSADYGTSEGQLSVMAPGGIDVVVSSPPYSEGLGHGGTPTTGGGKAGDTVLDAMQEGYGHTKGQLGQTREGSVEAVISSPPYNDIASGAGGLNTIPAEEGQQGGRSANSPSQATDQRYGETNGQLARLEKGSVEAIVSSPPYVDVPVSTNEHGGDQINRDRLDEALARKARGEKGIGLSDDTNLRYGTTEGQLGALRAGGVEAVVSSPPYAETLLNDDQRQATKGEPLRWGTHEEYGTTEGQLGILKEEQGVNAVVTSPPYEGTILSGGGGIANEMRSTYRDGQNYGDHAEQLGAKVGDTFWHAARDIVAESFALLVPGGYAVWIVKAFVRDKQIVNFPGDWRKLCEYCGFETLTEVHALFTTELGTHTDLVTQEDVTTTKEKKSFFRRLAEKKGSPRIDHEVVWIMRKPCV